MFSGIVSDIGEVRRVEKRGDTHISIAANLDRRRLEIGRSIACNGICFTVADKDAGNGGWFAVTASAETLAKTNAGDWQTGAPVNLEGPVRVGDELGGHLVTGHVDGLAELIETRPQGESIRMMFRAPAELARFIAPKGSVALDGVSLTVNAVDGDRFGVNIVPYTLKVTTLGSLKPGAKLNLEADLIARYIARLMTA